MTREAELVAFLGRLRDAIEDQYDPAGMIAAIEHYRDRQHRCPPLRLDCKHCGAQAQLRCRRLRVRNGLAVSR
jgi:hypothetical protein